MKKIDYNEDYEFLRAMIYMTISQVIQMPISNAFSLYSHFVIEENFGFNKLTLKLFITDQIKTIFLSFVIGTPIFYVILWVIRWGGEYFWIYLSIVTLILTFVMITIYPTVIAPMFNKYVELQDGELKDAVYKLASDQKFPLTKLYEVDGSTRSSHSNAYMYGFGSNKRIVLFDTLKSQVDTKGIVSILAHEIGHWKKSHTIKLLIITQLYLLMFFYIFGKVLYTKNLYEQFGFSDQPIFIGLMLFSSLYGPIEHVFSLFQNILSRKFEYEADEYATELGFNLTEPLGKIHVENLSFPNPDWFYSFYHYSHPTLIERIRAMEKQKQKRE